MTITEKIVRLGEIQDRLFVLQHSQTDETEVLKMELKELMEDLEIAGDI